MPSDVESILERVADAAAYATSSPPIAGHVDLYPVVAICGGRGTGKTTAMLEAGLRLAEEGHTVLPMLRPDLYTGGESLLMNAIQATRTVLKQTGRADELLDDDSRDGSTSAVGVTLDEVARQMLRRASAARFDQSSFVGGLDQQVADDSRATEATSTLESEWAAFVAALAPGTPHVIVLIDDLDLATERVSDFLVDLRTMAMAEGIIFVVALDLDETRRVLTAKHDVALSASRGASVTLSNGAIIETASPSYAVVNAQLSKVLPPELRVSIDPLSEHDRLNFVPKGETESILDLLRGVPLGGYSGTPDLGSLFSVKIGRRTVSTCYASTLSANRRALTSLHHGIARLTRSGMPRKELRRAVAMELIVHALEEGIKLSKVVGLSVDAFIRPDTPSPAGERTITIDFTCLRYFTNYHGFSQITGLAASGGSTRPGAQSAESLPPVDLEGEVPHADAVPGMAPRGPDPSSDRHSINITSATRSTAHLALSDEDTMGPAVDAALTYGMLLARDLTVIYGIPGGELGQGSPPRRGGFGRHMMAIAQTDDEFLVLPQWDGYFDVWLFDQFWDGVVRATKKPVPDLAATSTAAILDAWAAVATIQARRRLPRIRPLVTRMRAGEIDLPAIAADVFAQLVEVYEAELEAQGVRSNDYVDWFEGFLPFALHPLVMRRDVAQSIWTRWRTAIDGAGRWEITRRDLGATLASRVERSLGERWIEPVIEQLEALHWPGAEDLRRRHEYRILQFDAQRSRFAVPAADRVEGVSGPGAGDVVLTRALLAALNRALAETNAELEADAVSFGSSED